MSSRKLTLSLIVLLALAACCVAHGEIAYYVSTTGNDSNPGTLSQPFATIEKARDVVRAISPMTDNVVVYIRSGRYNLSSFIEFKNITGRNDSGRNGYTITYRDYPGETPVIVAGQRLTGWTLHSGNIYKKHVPAIQSIPTDQLRLLEDDVAGVIAMAPNEGWFRLENAQIHTTPTAHTSFQYKAEDADLTGWDTSQLQVHLVHMGTYNSEHLKVTSVDLPNRRLHIDASYLTGPYFPANGKSYRLENCLELLDAPGEFYADVDTGYVYYYPRGDISTACIEVITLRSVIDVSGTSAVSNLKFQGLTFQGSLYWHGYGQVQLSNADYVELRDCRSLNAGSYGITIHGPSDHCTVTGCEIGYSGEHGIQIAGEFVDNGPTVPATCKNFSNVITNNYIHHPGTMSVNGCGIALYWQANDNQITHNLITDSLLCGISMFSAWDRPRAMATMNNNVIMYNDFARSMIHSWDGGQLYIGATTDNTDFVNNRLTDAWSYFVTTYPQPEQWPGVNWVFTLSFDPGMLGVFNTYITNNICYGANANNIESGNRVTETLFSNNYFENPDNPGMVYVDQALTNLGAFNSSLVDFDNIGLTADYKYWYPQEVARPVALPFNCGFEGTLSPFYLHIYNNGLLPEYFTTSRVHGGDYALQVDKDVMVARYRHHEQISSRVSIWMYDDTTKTNPNCFLSLQTGLNGTAGAAVGVDGTVSSTYYTVNTGSQVVPTSIPRSTGWHKLEIEVDPSTGAVARIDGQSVGTATGFKQFDVIDLGDVEYGSDSKGICFDDLTISEPIVHELQTGSSIPMDGLVGWFQADTCTGPTTQELADLSGMGNDLHADPTRDGGLPSNVNVGAINGHNTISLPGSILYVFSTYSKTWSQAENKWLYACRNGAGLDGSKVTIFTVGKNWLMGDLISVNHFTEAGGYATQDHMQGLAGGNTADGKLMAWHSSYPDGGWGWQTLPHQSTPRTINKVPFIAEMYDGAALRTSQIRVNGTATTLGYNADSGTPGAFSTLMARGITIGGYINYIGKWDFAEVIVYNRQLTLAERHQVGWYLKNKYGITANYTQQPGTLSGKVTLADYAGNKTTVPVTVEIRGGTTRTETVYLDANGNFSIPSVSAGTYTVWIKAPHWLGKLVTGVVINGNFSMPAVNLINGDAVASNEVDFDDFNAVVAAFGSLPGDENWDANADLDGTGEVDFDDFNLVVARFGEIGE